MELCVDQVVQEAEAIASFWLVDPKAGPLTPFEAGAHVEVDLGEGYLRPYSLSSDPAHLGAYRITIQRERGGRGGSIRAHAQLRPGSRIEVSEPRNCFSLAPGDGPHILLAGGIGLTPLLSMAYALARRKADFTLICCTRSPERTPFRGELQQLSTRGEVKLHHDGGDPSSALDLGRLLSKSELGAHVYACGPPGFLKAFRTATEGWPQARVHEESFRAEGSLQPGERRFVVEVPSAGIAVQVSPEETILSALRRSGLDPLTVCELGTCGTCRARVLAGEPDHRDKALTPTERATSIAICVSRCLGDRLVIELDPA